MTASHSAVAAALFSITTAAYAAVPGHPSRNVPRPILIDLREVPRDVLAHWDLIAFPDGCRLRYGGSGKLDSFCP